MFLHTWMPKNCQTDTLETLSSPFSKRELKMFVSDMSLDRVCMMKLTFFV